MQNYETILVVEAVERIDRSASGEVLQPLNVKLSMVN